MAQYRFASQPIKASDNRSIIAAAAYRSASRLVEVVRDKESGIEFEKIHDYSHKEGVVHSGMIAPEGAPEWCKDRQAAWDKAKQASRQWNEQLAQEIQVSIPVEMDQHQGRKLVEDFIRNHYAANGIIADYSIHWDNPKNPHVHILLSTREILQDGFGLKNRDWHRKGHLKQSRKLWCDYANKHLALCGIDARVDHRSYKDQGIELEPTIHEGVAAREIMQRGEHSDRIEVNWEIKRNNLRKVIERPDILLRKLSAEKPMFTEADIAREAFIMTEGVDAYYGKLLAAVKASDSLVKLEETSPEGKILYAHKSFTQSKEQMEKEAALLAERKSFEIEMLDEQLSIMRGTIEIPDNVAAKVKEIISGADVVAVMASEDPLATRTAIRTAAEVYRAGGYRVSQIALTAIDAHALAVATELGSVAIEDWLHRGDEAEITDQDVFILHEASRVDVDAMGRVAAHVRAKGAKLICLGDAAHIAAFNSSAAFRSVDQITQTVALEKEYPTEKKAPAAALDPLAIIEKLSLQNATFTEATIAKEVFTVTHGDDAQYEQLLRAVMQHKELVTLDRVDLKGKARYTSARYLTSEQNLFASVSELNNRNSSSITIARVHAALSPMLADNSVTQEQIGAVGHIVTGPDVTTVIGKAGTGKTTKVIAPASKILQDAGYNVTGIALAAIAAQGINREAGIDAYTIHSWLTQLKYKPLTDKDVIILDEAGMVDVRSMEKITAAVEAAGARLVCIGDDAQLAAINAGAAFRALESITGSVAVTQVFRQRQEWQKRATEALGDWDVESAIKAYSDGGFIVWSKTENDTLMSLVKSYVLARDNAPDNSRLAFGFTNDEVDMLNHAIRSALKRRGELEGGRVYDVATGKTEFAPGDRVIFTDNEYKIGVRNGNRAEVAAVDELGITVTLEDGKQLTIDLTTFNDVKHAYASTIHSTQGVTIDEAYVLASKGYDANLAYVSLSRFRNEMKVYADQSAIQDARALTGIMSRDRGKDLAADYQLISMKSDAYGNVAAYIDHAKRCRELFPQILAWAELEDAELDQHPDWKVFEAARGGRKHYAQRIATQLSHHRRFIREAGIYLDTLKQHAGITDRILTAEQKAEKDAIARYQQLSAAREASPELAEESYRLADSIVRGRIGNRALYTEWFKEHKINSNRLHQDAIAYAAKGWNESLLFVEAFAKLETAKFGQRLSDEATRERLVRLEHQVTAARTEYMQLTEKLAVHDAVIGREATTIKRLQGEITDREVYLARAFGNPDAASMIDAHITANGLDTTIKAIQEKQAAFAVKKRYNVQTVIQHVELRHSQRHEADLAAKKIVEITGYKSYQAVKDRLNTLTEQLGRFTEEFDYKQLGRAVNIAQGRQAVFTEKRDILAAPAVKEAVEQLEAKDTQIVAATELPYIEASLQQLFAKDEIAAIEKAALSGKAKEYAPLLEARKAKKDTATIYHAAGQLLQEYKQLLAEDKKLLKADNTDLEARKAVNTWIIGHEAVLRHAFAGASTYSLREAGADEIITLGLNRGQGFKQYIATSAANPVAPAAPQPVAAADPKATVSPQTPETLLKEGEAIAAEWQRLKDTEQRYDYLDGIVVAANKEIERLRGDKHKQQKVSDDLKAEIIQLAEKTFKAVDRDKLLAPMAQLELRAYVESLPLTGTSILVESKARKQALSNREEILELCRKNNIITNRLSDTEGQLSIEARKIEEYGPQAAKLLDARKLRLEAIISHEKRLQAIMAAIPQKAIQEEKKLFNRYLQLGSTLKIKGRTKEV